MILFAFRFDRCGNIIVAFNLFEDADVIKRNGVFVCVGNDDVVNRGCGFRIVNRCDLTAVEPNGSLLRFGVCLKADTVSHILYVVFVDLFAVCVEVFIITAESDNVFEPAL